MKEKFDTPYTDSDHTGNGGIRKAASKNIVKEEEIKAYISMEGIGPYFGSALICLIF
mgnify:FL=1